MDLTAIPGLAPYAGYAAALVGIAAIIAPYLPPPAMPASGFYPIVYAIVNWLARNVGHARNASAPAMSAIATPNNGPSVTQ